MTINSLVNTVLLELSEEVLFGENIPLSPINTQLKSLQEMLNYENIPLTDELILGLHNIIDPTSMFSRNFWRAKLQTIMTYPRNLRGVIQGLADSSFSYNKDLRNSQKINQAQQILNMFATYEKRHEEKPSTTIINKTGIRPRGYY